MAVNLSPIGNGFQFFTTTGLPLAGGLLYTYQAGSTTPLATYTDPSGLTANTNPIILGTDGRPPQEIWLLSGYNYKFVLADSNNSVIQTYDNLYGVPTASTTNTTVVPSGLISLWSGSIGSIPSGWVLCDGNNSTPDLRDRFIVGAGNNYAVAGQGGSTDSIVVSHTHAFTGNTTGSTSLTGTFFAANRSGGSPTGEFTYTGTTADSNLSGGGLTGDIKQYAFDGTHTHTTSGSNASTGVSGTNANLPPYYALAYIMKS